MGRKAKVIIPAEPFWGEIVSLYFQFCRDKFGVNPTFDGSAPKDLKSIIKILRERATDNDVDWTFEIASRMLKTFLEFAYQDPWLKDNFLLSNINRQKDKILFKIHAIVKQKQSDLIV